METVSERQPQPLDPLQGQRQGKGTMKTGLTNRNPPRQSNIQTTKPGKKILDHSALKIDEIIELELLDKHLDLMCESQCQFSSHVSLI